MAKFILVDPFNSRQGDNDAAETFNTLTDLQKEVTRRADRFDTDDYDFETWQGELEAFEIATEIPLTIEKTTTVVVGVPVAIPAPNPGESVTDYARRITATA